MRTPSLQQILKEQANKLVLQEKQVEENIEMADGGTLPHTHLLVSKENEDPANKNSQLEMTDVKRHHKLAHYRHLRTTISRPRRLWKLKRRMCKRRHKLAHYRHLRTTISRPRRLWKLKRRMCERPHKLAHYRHLRTTISRPRRLWKLKRRMCKRRHKLAHYRHLRTTISRPRRCANAPQAGPLPPPEDNHKQAEKVVEAETTDVRTPPQAGPLPPPEDNHKQAEKVVEAETTDVQTPPQAGPLPPPEDNHKQAEKVVEAETTDVQTPHKLAHYRHLRTTISRPRRLWKLKRRIRKRLRTTISRPRRRVYYLVKYRGLEPTWQPATELTQYRSLTTKFNRNLQDDLPLTDSTEPSTSKRAKLERQVEELGSVQQSCCLDVRAYRTFNIDVCMKFIRSSLSNTN
uniref:Chromo domain-containing protein n=1 Tax=Ditylenchus dipsaci TaxID=166011 RepID=A0A915DDH5_9BILA